MTLACVMYVWLFSVKVKKFSVQKPILLTNYSEESPFTEANISMATQEDPALYGTQRYTVMSQPGKGSWSTQSETLAQRNIHCWTCSAIKFLCLMLKGDKPPVICHLFWWYPYLCCSSEVKQEELAWSSCHLVKGLLLLDTAGSLQHMEALTVKMNTLQTIKVQTGTLIGKGKWSQTCFMY